MITVLGLAGVLIVFLFMAVVVAFPKVHPEHMTMTAEEEARYDLHPTLRSQPLEITGENVLDVINDSIESGVEHPALVLRKAQS